MSAADRVVLGSDGLPADAVVWGGRSDAAGLHQAHRGFPDEPRTMYCASLAKQVVGIYVALLVRRGVVDVDAPIGRYVSGLPDWGERITLRQLLTHTSGLPAHAPTFDPAGPEPWTNELGMTFLRSLRSPAEPGTFVYSGLGYQLLAEAIDVGTFAQEFVFDPLCMRDTRFWSGPAAHPPGAWSLVAGPAPLSVGDGGLWSTVPDLLALGRAMLEDSLGIRDLVTDVDYGWGVHRREVGDVEVFSHEGSWPGATSKLIWAPSVNVVVAVLSDSDDVEAVNELADRLLCDPPGPTT